MPIQRFHAKVSEMTKLGSKFIFLTFELVEPNRIIFEAGQYLLLEVPGIDQKKSYSIVSSPSTDHKVEILVDVSPGGPGSMYISSLQPGSDVFFFAPAGRFTMASLDSEIGKEEKNIVCIATGSGIAPVRSMILTLLLEKQDKRNITLYWGLRSEDNLFWQDEFQELSEQSKNFVFHPVLSQASEQWPLCRGRVTDCLSIHPMIKQAGYYLCGNKHMIADVKELLTRKGIQPEHIHAEEFT